MATRIRTLDSIVTATGEAVGQNWILTIADDTEAAALIASGRAVALADTTTCLTLFGTDRWVAMKVGTGAL